MTTEKPKIGFVGVGGMGQAAHLRNYATLPECEVAALAELRPKLGQAVARRWNIPHVYTSAEEMLEKENLDGIVASQPFDRHGRIITPLYQSGLPIFSEKPLASSVEVGEQMLTALASGGSWHMVGYHKRSDPATEAAKAEIDRLKATGELGRLRYVRLLMPSGDWVANGFVDNIHTDEPGPDPPADTEQTWDDPYIGFVNYYIHQVNLMRHLLGEPYHVTYADPSGVLLAGQSESGIACALEMTPYQTTWDWQESALVCFEHGWVRLELPAPLALNRPGRVEFFADLPEVKTPQTTVPQLPWVHAMRRQASNFIAAIKGERKPPCEAQEALEDLQVARDYITLWKG